MSGDEDLGQNIIMKGDKFHYNQQLAQGAPVVAAKTTPVAAAKTPVVASK
jgi:hypothetical protein